MLNHYRSGKLTINIDETALNHTNYYYKLWQPITNSATYIQHQTPKRLSIIAAIDTDGRIYAATTFVNVDSDIIRIFILRLIHKLEAEHVDVQQDVLFLLDNAPYHTSGIVRRFFEAYELNVAWTAPYGYNSSPVERIFSRLKLGDLNESKIRLTGK